MQFEEAYSIWTVGGVSQADAAQLLGVSDRTMRRWVERYDDGGVDALIDKRVGRSPANAAPVDEVLELVMNYRERHDGWTVMHFHDHYRDAGGARSHNWVRQRRRPPPAAARTGADAGHGAAPGRQHPSVGAGRDLGLGGDDG